MEIFRIKDNDTLTLVLTGELNTSTAPDLEKLVQGSLGNIKNLIFDFGKLDYISSAGLRVLLIAQKAISGRGTIVVKNVNDTVRDILDMTGFSNILTVEQ